MILRRCQEQATRKDCKQNAPQHRGLAEIDLSAFKTCVTESKKQEDRLKSS